MNTLRIVLSVMLFSAVLSAQGISPPIAEYRGDRASGMFTIQNTTESDMAVILATKSFTVDEHGQVQYRPLDQSVKIKLGASSFVLRSHDSRMIFYKGSFSTSPVSFSIIATMTQAKPSAGMRINFIFPHMVYVYQKEKLDRSDITMELVNGTLRICNSSQKLGRVKEGEASKQQFGSFPIYPNQTREVAVVGATNATVKFEDGFKVDIP